MALDKAIQSGREHRKPYRGAKSVDHTCRNHGGCLWCEENRKYRNLKRAAAMQARQDEAVQEAKI